MAEQTRIPTNLRTLLILEVLGRSEHPLTASEINREIGLPKQTVHRLCTTLEREGFLTREADGKRLRPSRRLRLLGEGLLYSSRDHHMRHHLLAQLAEHVKETVNFVVPADTGMRYLDRVDTDWPFRIQLPIGTNVPFHCTASGKVFLASMSRAMRKKFVSSMSLKKLTNQTHTTSEELLAELDQIAKLGYALDREEFMDQMVAVAVPITDENGRYTASLACHGPLQRMSLDQAAAHVPALQESARKLQAALFDTA